MRRWEPPLFPLSEATLLPVPPLNCVNFGSLKKEENTQRQSRPLRFFFSSSICIHRWLQWMLGHDNFCHLTQSERRLKWLFSWENEEKVNRGRSWNGLCFCFCLFLGDFHRGSLKWGAEVWNFSVVEREFLERETTKLTRRERRKQKWRIFVAPKR